MKKKEILNRTLDARVVVFVSVVRKTKRKA